MQHPHLRPELGLGLGQKRDDLSRKQGATFVPLADVPGRPAALGQQDLLGVGFGRLARWFVLTCRLIFRLMPSS